MEDKEDEFQNNGSNCELIKVQINKRVDAFIVDKEFFFGFEVQTKDNIKIFRCKEYRKVSKCPALIKMKDDNIIYKNFIHNHSDNAKECSKYILKSNIKDNIKATRNIFQCFSSKNVYKWINKNDLKNIPKFSSIKSSIYREIKKNLPKEINSLNELDLESPYTKTKNNKQFLIYKSEKISIFQSELQSKLMLENYSDIFILFSRQQRVYIK